MAIHTALASKNIIRSLLAQSVFKQENDSLLWDLSGSALVHILIILGLGFYVSLADVPSLPTTISIKLSTHAELSESNQIGEGEKAVQTKTEPEQQEPRQEARQEAQNNIIHITQAAQLASNSRTLIEQQRLLEEIKKQNQVIQDSERVGFLGTHESRPAYVAYQEYWRRYVGEFGTEHYPDELLQNKLDGELELDIAIDAKGVLKSVTIHRSSGHPSLDKAAIKIAKQASPYRPLPPEMTESIDVLHIIRIWRFNNRTLVSQSQG